MEDNPSNESPQSILRGFSLFPLYFILTKGSKQKGWNRKVHKLINENKKGGINPYPLNTFTK